MLVFGFSSHPPPCLCAMRRLLCSDRLMDCRRAFLLERVWWYVWTCVWATTVFRIDPSTKPTQVSVIFWSGGGHPIMGSSHFAPLA